MIQLNVNGNPQQRPDPRGDPRSREGPSDLRMQGCEGDLGWLKETGQRRAGQYHQPDQAVGRTAGLVGKSSNLR